MTVSNSVQCLFYLGQLCPTAALSKVSCGPIKMYPTYWHPVLLDNLELDIFDAGGPQYLFIIPGPLQLGSERFQYISLS